jgi:ubiquitin-conjugating enzyme E2 O
MDIARPGDHVIFKSEDQKRPAIVQSVDAARRIATILFPDTNTKELVSLLELDPHGTNDFSVAQSAFVGEGLGVHRGDFVFVHKAGTSNGLMNPRVPCIGEVEVWVREAPSTPEGRLIGWRLQMSELGGSIAASRGSNHTGTQEGRIRTLFDKDPSLWWFGEVSEVRLCVYAGLL